MRKYISTLCLAAMLAAGPCDVPTVEQREVSTKQSHYRVSDADWPKGLFYGLGDVLYWIGLVDRQLTIRPIKDGRIGRARIAADLSDVSGVFRLRGVTSDSRDTLFVLFSGVEQIVVRLNLRDPVDARRLPYGVPGYTNTIRYIPHWKAILVVGQSSSVLIHEDGACIPFGPEIFNRNDRFSYTTAAVSGDRVALNVNRGLRIYSRSLEQVIWKESASGFIAEVANAGQAWAATEISFDGKLAGVRVFSPKGHRYVSRAFPLPKPEGDGYWRITNNGEQAIAWSRNSDDLFRISGRSVDKFSLKEATPRGAVCPAFSESVYLINKDGYTIINFD